MPKKRKPSKPNDASASSSGSSPTSSSSFASIFSALRTCVEVATTNDLEEPDESLLEQGDGARVRALAGLAYRDKHRNHQHERGVNQFGTVASTLFSLASTVPDQYIGDKDIVFSFNVMMLSLLLVISNCYLSTKKGEHSRDRTVGTLAAGLNIILGLLCFTTGMVRLGLDLSHTNDDAWMVPLSIFQVCLKSSIIMIYGLELTYFGLSSSETPPIRTSFGMIGGASHP